MAMSLEKIEAWLPSEDELLLETTTTTAAATEFDPSCFPTEFPYEFDSGSLTESDGSRDDHQEEEYAFLAGLTRRLTHQLAFNPKKRDDVAGSPESTLSGIGSCCWSVSVSSNGSPNGGPSPPTTPFSVQDDHDTLDRICAAAGHIARIKMGANKGVVGPTAVGPTRRLQSPCGLFSSQGFTSNASAVHQLYGHDNNQKQHMGHQLQQEQVIRKAQYSPPVWQKPQHQQLHPNWHHQPPIQQIHPQQQQQQQIPFESPATGTLFQERLYGKASRPLGLPQSAWPPLQPPQCLSNRPASYLGGGPTHFTNVKKERTGTGVFLPQPKTYYGNNSSIKPQYSDSSRRKAGCSTVVLPTKVIQALHAKSEDRNVNSLGHDDLRFYLGVSDYDRILARRNAIVAQHKRNVLRSEGPLNHELRLPTDWKY